MRILLLLPLLVLSFAETRADGELWSKNKLTPDQPFPAKVLAILPSWVGYHLLLEEIGGKQRLCVARVSETVGLEYRMLNETTRSVMKSLTVKDGWIYLTPSVDVNRFSWSIGAWKLGRIFREDDLLFRIVERKRKLKGEQAADDQLPAPEESKTKGTQQH